MSFIGLHIEPTQCHVLIVQENNEILGHCTKSYSVMHPQSGWVEQEAERVWQIAWQSLEDALLMAGRFDRPKSMAISVADTALIPVDRSGYTLRYAILGEDKRDTQEIQWLSEKFTEPVRLQTEIPQDAGDPLSKILWLQKNEPEIWKITDRVMFYEDFFLRRFCGNAVVSPSLASQTRMFDWKTNDWSDSILKTCAIDRNCLSPVAPLPGVKIGIMRAQLSHELGIHHEIPLVNAGFQTSPSACLEAARRVA